MPSMDHRNFTGGMLGWSAGADLLANANLLKSEGRVSLLAFATPSGANYVVVLDYGEPSYDIVFPSDANPAINPPSTKVAKSSEEAFAQFDNLIATYGSSPTDASGYDPSKASTFEELDKKLLSMAELPKDITIEMQRSGLTDIGQPKTALDLKFRSGLLSAIVGANKEGLRMARLNFESFPMELRLRALQGMRSSLLAKYMTGEVVSSLIQTNRTKRELYRQNIDFYKNAPMPNVLNSMATVSADPLIAVNVRFIDQHGNEVNGLPYEINVRGILNLKEAFEQTSGGANPGAFSSGSVLLESGMSGMGDGDSVSGTLVENWKGRSLHPSKFYHLLYKYRTSGSDGMPRGTVKISVTTSRNTNDTGDWGNNRLMVYDLPADASESRNGSPVAPVPKMLLYSHNYRLEADDSPERITVTVPVYIEPLPMHLIESPPGSGRVVSKWSIASDIGEIPSHQKVNVEFTVLRPEATGLWEEADALLPDTRDGYRDGMLQYDEFKSPQGRAAYRDNSTKASPVKGIRFVLVPDEGNAWTVSKEVRVMKPNFAGVMSAELTPGRYNLGMMVEINSDGTTGLEQVTSESDGRWGFSTQFSQLSSQLQSAVKQKYGAENIGRTSRFAPRVINLGIVESPAAFYYRKISTKDTTPIGVVGVKMVRTGSIADTGSSRFRNHELKQQIPPLLAGKEPESGSIYDVMSVDFPAIDNGWPGQTTETDERFFDTATLLLAPDSSVDLSMLSQYEQRYEAERDSGQGISPRLRAPAVGQRIEYMGYFIEHAYFDTAVGPSLLNKESAFGGGVQEYDMGHLETPFYDTGVIRCMLFYPQSGIMRRKMVVPGQQNINANLVVSARSSMAQWNPSQASMDRVFHFDVKSSPEGAILSGRWIPLESVGEYAQGYNTDERAFEMILDAIKRGGLPIRQSPKWNEFWSSTTDGWLFGGNDPTGDNSGAILDPSEVGGGGNLVSPPMTPMPPSAGGGLMPVSGGSLTIGGQQAGSSGALSLLGSVGKLENEGGELGDLIQAPTPTYGDEDEMGFVEG